MHRGMVSRWIFEVATTLPLLLDSVTAATLNGYYDASIAAIHHPLSIRTLGSLLPPLNPHPDSLIGLPTELPTCKLELSNDLALHEDCIYAWDMMEEQDSSLLTIYMGNFIIIGMDGGSSAALGFDSLGVPRVYWHSSCAITITTEPDTMDGIPFAFNSDVAHKNAIKITVAGIINKCVRLGYGGQNQAGQERRLSVVVQPVSKLSGPALLAINRARASGFDGARMHLNVDDLEQSTIEVVKVHTNAGMMMPQLPYTYCQAGGDPACGHGIECRLDPASSSGVRNILWGAIISSASCIWNEDGSGLIFP